MQWFNNTNEQTTALQGKMYDAEALGFDSSIIYIQPFSLYYQRIIIPKRFSDKILAHVLSQYLDKNYFFNPPLFLAIEGEPGEGKTSQAIATCTQKGFIVLYVSASSFSGQHEAESRLNMKKFYEKASILKKQGHPVAIVVDDFHKSVANEDDNVKRTINSDLLTGYLMNLAENTGNEKVPIILTANDLSKVYGPMLRVGRADRFYWQPTTEEKMQIIQQIFNSIVANPTEKGFINFFNENKNENIAFFNQLLNRHRLSTISKNMYNIKNYGIEGNIKQLNLTVNSSLLQLNYENLRALAQEQRNERRGK